MEKEVKKFKDGKNVIEKCSSEGIRMAPASNTIEYYWYEIILDVFNYEMRREAELQEVHKLYEDKRILEGLRLYKEGKVKEGAITDVDVRATVEGEKDSYMVTMKKWKPLDKFDKPKLIRHRYEIEDYIASMFFDCSCQDHMIMHYKANSSCACKHICAVMWKLMNEENMPKFFIEPDEVKNGYQKSNNIDLIKNLNGLPMKQFSQYMNVVALKEFRDIPSSLSYSIHRIPNLDYKAKYPEGLKPVWITFRNPEDAEKLIKASIKGYTEMLTSRKNNEEQIKEAVKHLLPEEFNGSQQVIIKLQNKITELSQQLEAEKSHHSPEQPGEEVKPNEKIEETAVDSHLAPAGLEEVEEPKQEVIPPLKQPKKKGLWEKIKTFFQNAFDIFK